MRHFVRLVNFVVLVAVWLTSPGVTRAAPGELTPIGVGARGNETGYWEYLPSAYGSDPGPWPVLVYLGGANTVGTGIDDSPCPWPLPAGDTSGEQGLCNSLAGGGVHELIYQTSQDATVDPWDDDARPFVVVAPQNRNPGVPYDLAELQTFIEYVRQTYDVDPRRMYLMGHSQGGRTALLYGAQHPRTFAATVVMPGGQVEIDPCELRRQALWAFHGELDPVPSFEVATMVSFVQEYNACAGSGPRGKLTLYDNADHNVWGRTYRPNLGMADPVDPVFDPYDVDVYAWLLEHDRPVVYAGPDRIVSASQTPVQLEAIIDDADPVVVLWSQVAGPQAHLVDSHTATPTVQDLQVGTYTFEVTVLDLDDLWTTDEVSLYVSDELPDEDDVGTTGPGSPAGGTTSTTGAEPETTGSSGGVGIPVTDTWTTTGGGDAPGSSDQPDSAGCGCSGSPRRGHGAAMLFLGAIGLLRRRWRRR